MIDKSNPLFRSVTRHSTKGARSYHYEVYVYNGRSPSSIHYFQEDNLWNSRQQAIHHYKSMLLEKKDTLVELNFAGVFEGGEVSVMELVSNAPGNAIAHELYKYMPDFEVVNHWMNTAAFEFDMYLKFGHDFTGYIENLKYGYMHPETGQLYGEVHTLPGTGGLFNHAGLITEVTFKNYTSTDLSQLMNRQYK